MNLPFRHTSATTDPPPPVTTTAPARHAIADLRLDRFRNYRALHIAPAATPVVLFGANGAGKTNLLEAISLLAPGRGLRGAALAEIAHDSAGGAPWAVASKVVAAGHTRAVGTALEPATAERRARRVVHVDGEPAGQTDLADHVRVVWLTPDMDRLFQDSPGARRRFLDRLVAGFNPDHARNLSAYERTLRERGRVLKSGSRDAIWLAALEQRMAGHGVAITADRVATVARLAAAPHPPAPFPAADLALAGELAEWLATAPALAAEDRLSAALAASRDHDAVAGGAAHGPHRDDLLVTHRGHAAPAARCSTGEQKALVITILVAFAHLQALEHGSAPVMLLDEIAAHLDGDRRAVLFDTLCDLGSQAWLTGTDARVFRPLAGRAQFFHVAEASLTEATVPSAKTDP